MADKILVELAVENTRAIKAINQTLKSMQGLGTKGKKELTKLERGFISFAGNLSALAIQASIGAIKQAFSESIDVAIRFDKALIGVGKTTNFTEKELKDFGKQMQVLSRTIPVAADELLDLAKIGGQLGIEGSKNLSKFVTTMAQLQVSTDIAGEAGAQSILKILNLTGEGVEGIEGFGAAVAFLGNNFKVTESQIVKSATNVAGGLAQFEVSSADVLGLSTNLVELGIRAELSGSVLGRSFRGIRNAINAGGAAMTKLSELSGIASKDLKQAFEKDAVSVFRKFIKGLSGVKNIDKTLELFKLRGEEILKVLPSMAKQSSRLGLALDDSNRSFTEQTALIDEATRAFGTLEARNKLVTNRLEEQQKKAGDKIAELWLKTKERFADTVDAASKAATKLDTNLTKAFGDTPEEKLAALNLQIELNEKALAASNKTLEKIKGNNESSFWDFLTMDAEDAEKEVAGITVRLQELNKAKDELTFVGPIGSGEGEGVDGPAPSSGGAEDEEIKTQEMLNKIEERHIAIKELQDIFQEEQDIAAAERQIANNELEDELRIAAIESLRESEIAKIEIKRDADLQRTKLIKDQDLRELEQQKIRLEADAKLAKLDNKRRLQAQKALQTEQQKLDKDNDAQTLNLAKSTADAFLALTGDNQLAALAISKAFAIADIFIKDGASRAAANLVALQTASAGGPFAPAVYATTLAGLNAAISVNTALAAGAVAAQTVASVARFQTGGVVSGPQTGDLNLARVDGGEGILTREGVRAVADLNSGNAPNTGGTGDTIVNIQGDFIGEEQFVDTMIDMINDATEFRNREVETGTG